MPERIRALVFLDAFVPELADSLNGLLNKALPPEVAAQFLTTFRGAAAEGNSGLMQPIPAEMFNVVEAKRDWVNRRCRPQALATFESPVLLSGKHEKVAQRVYILADGWDPSPFRSSPPGRGQAGLACGQDAVRSRRHGRHAQRAGRRTGETGLTSKASACARAAKRSAWQCGYAQLRGQGRAPSRARRARVERRDHQQRGQCRANLFAHGFGKFSLQRHELGRCFDRVVPWMRQRYSAIELDAAGPRAHHHHARAHEHRLVDVMGDEQHRGTDPHAPFGRCPQRSVGAPSLAPGAAPAWGAARRRPRLRPPRCRAAALASARASGDRARRTARPSAACAARWPTRVRARCAAACRPTVVWDSGPRSRAVAPSR